MSTETNQENQKTEKVEYAEVVETSPLNTNAMSTEPLVVAPLSNKPTTLQSVDKHVGKPDMSKYSPADIEKFKQKTGMIKSDDNTSLLNFGLDVQNKLSASSNQFLTKVRAFDAGEIGTTITDLLANINMIEIDPSQQSGFKRFLMMIPGMKKVMMSATKMFQKYDSVAGNVETIVTKLDQGRITIVKDNNQLEQLFQENVSHIKDIEELLVIGHLKYEELQAEIAEMEANAANYEDYEIADKKEFLNRLDKRLHDMAITRIITIQSLPQIRLVQNNNHIMAEKIQSTIVTTIPIWQQQLAIAVSLSRQKNIVDVITTVNDTTNTILKKNSEMLKQNSIDVAKQNERGIVEIETLRTVQTNLVATINEIQQIKEQGTINRRNADKALTELETELTNTVTSINTKTRQLK